MTFRINYQSSMMIIALSYIILIPFHLYRVINVVGYEDVTKLFRGAAILKIYILLLIFMAILRSGCILTYHTKRLID